MSISITKKVAALSIAGLAAVGGGAAAWAQSTGGSSTPPASSASTTAPATAPATGPAAKGAAAAAHPRLARLATIAKRSDHGDLEIKGKDGKYVTVTFDRGTVDSATATSVTLDRPDGQKATLTVTPDTKVHGATSAATLQTGKDAVVVSQAGSATQILQKAQS